MSDVSSLFQSNKRRWSYATWLSEKYNYLYVETPKVGCTTIKHVLQKLEGLPEPEAESAIHYRIPAENYVKNALVLQGEIDERIRQGMFVFTFVRDPKTRLISAYNDKILGSPGPFWENYRIQIREVCDLSHSQPISLENFLSYIEETPNEKRDIHWKSQFSLLRPDIIPYTVIGRFERFSDELNDILEKIFHTEASNHHVLMKNKSSHVSQGMENLDERICEVYKSDYTAFSYT